MRRKAVTRIALTVVLTLATAVTLVISTACNADSTDPAEEGSTGDSETGEVDDMAFADRDMTTDTSIASIDIEAIMGGGPAKDGIPALTSPEFVTVDDSQVPADDVLGILLDIDGDVRYYPYNILVWHEVVNDEVGGKPVTVTF